jgi:hypothetical protein
MFPAPPNVPVGRRKRCDLHVLLGSSPKREPLDFDERLGSLMDF